MFFPLILILLLLFSGGLAVIRIFAKSGRRKYYIGWLFIWFLALLTLFVPEIIPTKDSGKECFNSSECEGYCTFVEWPKEWNENSTEKIQGKCSSDRLSSGCHNIIEDGVPAGICID